ncbi:cation:proton antiporter domain-containing protein [Aquicella lusitana]|uniref:Transporter (CPA2 family) n=1 Tax=Aquicella lusitana TaxID=254246 RepID=A0A370GT56_9COXI|nr:cation:proton antiporter [Aquicella lusitana]RDI46882.1 transporter (CPA2 family) [Aquicella lusitana]VVC73773.1 Glutathione-regulated potassium-efflux system protein KefC [Aquicella lusitana]
MAQAHPVTYVIFLIFTGTAILSTIALFTRQSLLVAYIALGAILGPWGLKLIDNAGINRQAGDIGIIFLLFLLGLHLQPQNLFHSLRKMSLITLTSSFIFFILGFLTSHLYGYTFEESALVGIAAMFSSTIIGIKLLPTTILHHQHTGELVISILLLQDIIAIAVLLGMEIAASRSVSYNHVMLVISAFPVLLLVAYVFQRYILARLLERFDKIHEYIFILSIGWCLCMAQLSRSFGLSEEIGAFVAGVALASNPISFYIAESLKPLRDFFLVIFFFTIGAGFNFDYFSTVIVPALTLAAIILLLKPVVFNWLLSRSGEVKSVSWEIGVRLGQMSEFSLLVIYMALETKLLSPASTYMVEAAIIITFIVSCYWTVMRYPTPLASTDKLRRD